jgi:DNA-binding NarL/FixJ family response regulator
MAEISDRVEFNPDLHVKVGTQHGTVVVSKRSVECFRLFVEFESQQMVAEELELSWYTVRNHLTALYHALDVTGQVGAMKVLGWLKLPERSGSDHD